MINTEREMNTGNPFKKSLKWRKPGKILEKGRKKAKNVPVPREARWFNQRKEQTIKKIKILSEEVITEIRGFIFSYPSLDNIHPFYRSLIEVWSSIEKIKGSLDKIWSAQFKIRKMVGNYVQKIDAMKLQSKTNGEKEEIVKKLLELKKTAFKEISSTVKNLSEEVSYIVRITKKLAEIPDYDPQLPSIVVAGPPNSGKSTLVKKVSNAKVETASYPFTTKRITFGHINIKISNFINLKAQICDTPGLFDRSLGERKEPEILAIKAIKHLADALIILLDASLTNPLGISGQKKIYKIVRLFFQKKKYIVAINKVDISNEKVLTSIEGSLAQREEKYIKISLKENKNMDLLFERLANIFEGSRFLTQKSRYKLKEQQNERIINKTQEN